MLWNLNYISVTMDISTYCNAGCPQCHRTNPNGLGKVDWLPLVQWTLEDFKRAITPDQFKYINRISFVGTWGDSVMNKDIFKIVEYITSHFIPVSIETNGSIRDEQWWWDLGVMGGSLLSVRFDVDGIDQEMHSKYRRFTSLDKILNNMNTLSETKARVGSQTVVFKHNEDYLEEIKQLCKLHGSKYHTNVLSDRFENGDIITHHQDENGNEFILEKADYDILKNGVIVGTDNKKVLDEEIKCRWALPRNEILVNFEGQIIPCCYLNNGYVTSTTKKQEWFLKQNHLYNEYNENREKYNVFHNSIHDIMNSDWFKTKLPESMKSNNPMKTCARHCSNRINKEHQLRDVGFFK